MESFEAKTAVDLHEVSSVGGYGREIAYWNDGPNRQKGDISKNRELRFDALYKMIQAGTPLQLKKPEGDVTHVTIKKEFLVKMDAYKALGREKGYALGDGTGKHERKEEFQRLFGKSVPTNELGDVDFTKFAKTKIPWGGKVAVEKIRISETTPMIQTAKIDSTKHEVNICYGFTRLWAEKNNKFGITTDMDHATAWKILNDNKAFAGNSYKNSDANWSVNAFDAGYATAKACGKVDVAYPTSGGKIVPTLDKIYSRYGASNLEPKTDIMVGKDRVSVKNQKGAQLGSMQAGEATAAFYYGLENTKGSSNFNKDSILGLVFKSLTPQGWSQGRRMFGGSVEEKDFDHFITNIMNGKKDGKILKKDVNTLNRALGGKRFVKEMTEMIDARGVEISKNIATHTIENFVLQPDNFPTFVATHGGTIEKWATKKGLDVSGGITPELTIEYFETGPKTSVSKMLNKAKAPMVEQIKNGMKLAWTTSLPDITDSIVEFLQSDALHEYITWEVGTGYHKFGNGQGTADTFLGWSDTGWGSYHSIGKPHGPVIQNLAKCTDLQFSDRGRNAVLIGDRFIRTGAIRLNLTKKCWLPECYLTPVNTDKAVDVFQLHEEVNGCPSQFFNLSEEDEKWCEEFGEAFTKQYDEKYLTEEYDNVLLEGVLDSIGRGLRSAGKTVVAWGKKVVEAIKQFIAWVRGTLAKLVAKYGKAVQQAFADSTLSAMQFFGVANQVQLSLA